MDRAKLLLDQLREGLTKGYVEEMPGFITFDYCDPTTRVDDHTLEIPTEDGTFIVTIRRKETPDTLKVGVIEIDGTITKYDYPEDLAGWQALVGGPIEPVYVMAADRTVEHLLIVNEEGIMMNLPYNPRASRLAGRTILGCAVVLEGAARDRWDKDV